MKHTFIFTAAAAIWLCPISHSQSAPILTRVDTSSDGTATLVVRNDSDVSLVAFVDVEESHPAGSGPQQAGAGRKFFHPPDSLPREP
jgi:hypothetical protein